MRLFGRFNQFTINEIMLTSVPFDTIKSLVGKEKIEAKIQPYRPRMKDNRNRYRHQIVLMVKTLPFALFKLYSLPLDSTHIKSLGLEPLPELVTKEKAHYALERMAEEGESAEETRALNPRSIKINIAHDLTLEGISFNGDKISGMIAEAEETLK